MIAIANKLEIQQGGVINVVGCEPLSTISSVRLSQSLNCKAAVIPVTDALRLIPGSRIVRAFYPAGQKGTGWFFQLPEGPPPNGNECPSKCLTDWYQILRDNARVLESQEENVSSSEFNYTGCQLYQDIFHKAPDPILRPNSNPLGGLYA